MIRILAAFAHPDDETVFAGGMLAMLSGGGAEVHYLCGTRGEGGEVGEPPVCSREELGRVREEELACATAALGGVSLNFLGYTDPPVDENKEGVAFKVDLPQLIDQIVDHIQSTPAEVVISHGSNGDYGHPAHVLMHRAALGAVQSIEDRTVIMYSVSAAFELHPRPRLANHDDPADFVFDIEPWLPEKLAAAQCHRTQQALFVRRASNKAGYPVPLEEVLMKRESLSRHWPPRDVEGYDPFKEWVGNNCGSAILS